MRARLVFAVALLCGTAAAGDSDFDRVVKAIESHYGTRHTHIPLLGAASLFVKIARPEGASSFKLAVFEDLKGERVNGDDGALDRFMSGLPGHGLCPLVSLHSRRDGESVYILAAEAGKSFRVLVTTYGRNEATVMEMKVNADTLMKLINSPEHSVRATDPY